MKARHARYPFLGAARQAVAEAGVDLVDVVANDEEVVERALDRVTSALQHRSIGDRARSDRIELLSYPVSRVLVSVVNENVLVRRYAQAEAAAAAERFAADFTDDTELQSVRDRGTVDRDELLREFDLASHVTSRRDGDYDLDCATYLQLAADLRDDEWRLVNRRLADGRVPVSPEELDRLLQAAVENRVREGLPLDVPEEIARELEAPADEVRRVLSDLDLTREIDTVVPELFPPCMQHLLDQVQRGEHLPHHSRFAITAFLANIGLTTDEIVEIYSVNPGFGEEMTRYQTNHIRGDSSPTEYTAPSCATMKAYGDCVNPDDLCDNINHPLSYYEVKLDDADEDDLKDWRDRENETEEADA